MLYTVITANELTIRQQKSFIIAQYHFTEIFAVFSDPLSKSAMSAMADGITSTDELPLYVLGRLFDSFSDESLSDVDNRNNNVNDVGELSDRVGGKMDTDSGSIFDGYSDVSDDECDGADTEDELRTVLSLYYHCTITVLSLYYHCTITVLSMLDDV